MARTGVPPTVTRRSRVPLGDPSGGAFQWGTNTDPTPTLLHAVLASQEVGPPLGDPSGGIVARPTPPPLGKLALDREAASPIELTECASSEVGPPTLVLKADLNQPLDHGSQTVSKF